MQNGVGRIARSCRILQGQAPIDPGLGRRVLQDLAGFVALTQAWAQGLAGSCRILQGLADLGLDFP
eukprot:3672706-Pyramimonas_sp.AAC.1